jgi:SagB-type dehydrogenase family enzyme
LKSPPVNTITYLLKKSGGIKDMKVNLFGISTLVALSLSLAGCSPSADNSPLQNSGFETVINLPETRLDSDFSIEKALNERRSVRDYTKEALTIAEISQLLWAAQGITSPEGYRTAPSAGGTYPLEIYLASGNVQDIDSGVYRYDPEEHALQKMLDGDLRGRLSEAALDQAWIREGAADIIIAAEYERTAERYGDRAERYVHMEAGHAAQNIYLQAAALNLGTVSVGAFNDSKVQKVLNLPIEHKPLYIMPVGRK